MRRFVDESGLLRVWDRGRDRAFSTSPGSVASETDFYLVPELAATGGDPLEMERQFADLEYDASLITEQWVEWVRDYDPMTQLPIPDVNRELISLFIALQFLRTRDARDILARGEESDHRQRKLHTQLLWDDGLVSELAERISSCTWIFAYNNSDLSLITSDNPVTLRTADNRMWLRRGILTTGTYVGYPLAPDVMMYCHPPEPPWNGNLRDRFGDRISPVAFTDGMASSENTGQIYMASRFTIANRDLTDEERHFATTIGTDIYAPPEYRDKNRQ